MDPPEDMEQDPFLRQWLAADEATLDNKEKPMTEEEPKVAYRHFLILSPDTPGRQFHIEHLEPEEQRLFYAESEEYHKNQNFLDPKKGK